MILPGWALASDQSPSASRFSRIYSEALVKVRDDVAIVQRLAVTRVQRCSRPAHQDGTRDQRLQLRGFLENFVEGGVHGRVYYQI